MKKILFILIILLLININPVKAPITNCVSRGAVSLELSKKSYFPGESLQGDIILTNTNSKSSPFIFTIKLSKDNYIPWKITQTKNIGPGTHILKIQHAFSSPLSTPYSAEIGKWNLQLTTQVDECIWNQEEILDIFTCSDGIRNGDEAGVDCGGSCQLKCPTSTRFPGQLIYKRGYSREKDRIWINMRIDPLPTALTYKERSWIDGSQISLNIPESTSSVAAYGCCCTNCNNEFSCNLLINNRYKVENYNEWQCGWNIKYL